MIFIHNSPLGCHGNLKSSNCVVTSRWVLQVTDFGLHDLRQCAENDSIGEHQYFRSKHFRYDTVMLRHEFLKVSKSIIRENIVCLFIYFHLDLLWKAPELLRDPVASIKGTQKGDIYAFAIILHEIMCRRGPFGACGVEEPKG
jgi:hypothetical protein